MKNSYAIGNISEQLVKVCERINMLSMGIEQLEESGSPAIDAYADMRFDELEHAQILVLQLTELISQDAGNAGHADEEGGGTFAAGELDDKKNAGGEEKT